MKTKRVLNWRPDVPDLRDRYMKVSRFRSLPKRVDLRDKCTPVEDQQDIGSCTAQASVAAMEYLDKRDDSQFTDLSRLFCYYISRALLDKDEDTGAYIREVIKALSRYGVCDEALWPYVPSKFTVKPPYKCFKDALKRRITEYQRIDSLKGIKQALADGFPVVFGFGVYDSFDRIGKSGYMPIPNIDVERMNGGHAVLAVGFDDYMVGPDGAIGYLICRNSWGSGWGDSGYFYMPYIVADSDMTADWWTIKRQLSPPTGIEIDGQEARWYIPIVGIVSAAWGWIFGDKQPITARG